jgi:hypothetical protein
MLKWQKCGVTTHQEEEEDTAAPQRSDVRANTSHARSRAGRPERTRERRVATRRSRGTATEKGKRQGERSSSAGAREVEGAVWGEEEASGPRDEPTDGTRRLGDWAEWAPSRVPVPRLFFLFSRLAAVAEKGRTVAAGRGRGGVCGC